MRTVLRHPLVVFVLQSTNTRARKPCPNHTSPKPSVTPSPARSAGCPRDSRPSLLASPSVAGRAVSYADRHARLAPFSPVRARGVAVYVRVDGPLARSVERRCARFAFPSCSRRSRNAGHTPPQPTVPLVAHSARSCGGCSRRRSHRSHVPRRLRRLAPRPSHAGCRVGGNEFPLAPVRCAHGNGTEPRQRAPLAGADSYSQKTVVALPPDRRHSESRASMSRSRCSSGVPRKFRQALACLR